MTRKEILMLASLEVKAEIERECVWVADTKRLNRETLEKIRCLIKKFDELSERLENYYNE